MKVATGAMKVSLVKALRLYKMTREGKIKNFTGIDAPFEPPENPDVAIMTGSLSIIDSVQVGLDHILPLVSFKQS
ncbi:MAG: hypothetical protein A2W85_01775 [Bacteroidetes bacterium GWF2_41_31]|nr:MAG: hypothetical protein A2W85_01775 [Bacteroidetes bacterium GWF2_41_31]